MASSSQAVVHKWSFRHIAPKGRTLPPMGLSDHNVQVRKARRQHSLAACMPWLSRSRCVYVCVCTCLRVPARGGPISRWQHQGQR